MCYFLWGSHFGRLVLNLIILKLFKISFLQSLCKIYSSMYITLNVLLWTLQSGIYIVSSILLLWRNLIWKVQVICPESHKAGIRTKICFSGQHFCHNFLLPFSFVGGPNFLKKKRRKKSVTYSKPSLVHKMGDQLSAMQRIFIGHLLYTRPPDKCCKGYKRL